MRCRLNISDLDGPARAELVQAFLDLKDHTKSPSRIPQAQTAVTNRGGNPNRYDDYVWMHNTVSLGAHRGPAFGPWHREFLHQIEFDLQQVSGIPNLTIPYWDWTTARDATSAGWPFSADLMGGFGNPGPGVTTGFVTTGLFANPATWRINIRRAGDGDTTLKRSRGVPNPADLPVRATALTGFGVGVPAGSNWPSVYDAAPWADANVNLTGAQVLSSFRKYLERLMHDGVHVWIGDAWEFDALGNPGDGGHMTFPAVAVNDPVFWLHHCNVDRLWSIWQRKSPTPGYLPQVAATAPAGHNGGDGMVNLTTAAWFATSLNSQPNNVQDHQAIGPWYRTDLPEITLDTPSLSFGSVPELRTTYMPVRFSVRSCQPVRFNVTAVTGANYSSPSTQGTVVVDHDPANDVVTARVYVAFTANGAVGVAQPGAVTIAASLIDTDGYDTPNPNDVLALGTWTVNLTATPVTRPRAAIALVLDRSGSMAASAGVAGSRYQMLQNSLSVVRDVMRPVDGVGVVTFDDVTTPLAGITEMGPAVDPPVAGTGRAELGAAITSPELVPRNTTGIGAGMINGAGLLDAERLSAGTPYMRFALCVMTDGNQNELPYVGDPPVSAAIAPYVDAIYAIGLGRPGEVSDTVLGTIANYMLVTGDITAAERRFRLTKYFVQILAGITRTAIVVDPQGDLHIGAEHRIPFFLTDMDLEVDVITLSPLAPLIDFSLEAPDGTVVDAAAALPTVEFHERLDDSFYRISMPIDPEVRTAGRWTAVLRLTKERLEERADLRERWANRLASLDQRTLPYSLVVQSYSDLELDVDVEPRVALVGDDVRIAAILTAFAQPFTGRAVGTATVTEPKGGEYSVALDGRDGRLEGKFQVGGTGLYTVRIVVLGRVAEGARFQREETRTVSVFRGEIPPGIGRPGEDRFDDRSGLRAGVRIGGRMVRLDDREQTMTEQDESDDPTIDGGDDNEAAEPAEVWGIDAQPDPAPEAMPAVEPEGAHPPDGHDHDQMSFTMFRLTDAGELEELQASDIGRGGKEVYSDEELGGPDPDEHHGHDHDTDSSDD